MEELIYIMARIYLAYWTPERVAAREAELKQQAAGGQPPVIQLSTDKAGYPVGIQAERLAA